MAYKTIILREAQREYESIVAYMVETLDNLQAARAFRDEFRLRVDQVCELPTMCPLSRMPELAARGYRTLIVANYVVLYKISENAIVIAHVFHQSQDYAPLV